MRRHGMIGMIDNHPSAMIDEIFHPDEVASQGPHGLRSQGRLFCSPTLLVTASERHTSN
jgi:hypothetical protein